MIALVVDPEACRARLTELEKVLQAASTATARLEKAKARFEAEQQAGRERLEAERAALAAEKKAHAERVVRHEEAVASRTERCGAIEEDARRWRRAHNVGIDLTDSQSVARLHDGQFAHQGQFDGLKRAQPEQPQETVLTRSGFDGRAFPAGAGITRSVPVRRGAVRRGV